MHLDLRDIAGLLGICMIATGLWLVSVPASLVVTGGLLLAGAVISARARAHG